VRGYIKHLTIIINWKQAQYVMVLCSFKEQLQQHVRVHAVEAVMACREIENNLHSLTGSFLFHFFNGIFYNPIKKHNFMIITCYYIYHIAIESEST